ncbi:hypothetical protein DLAC_00234 [Tieghemostelium lacteum]|uniref:Methyltransferase domain-containing protein n=1 Tax=Tieghemostelium lacteum TaxID=361077 RepID=A0A152A9G5_TIELA|nr:hypothetical protein DLAC_00234 [Tieghemostelium lacteum]|eukprot:KYR02771.1 hypothetical protein DLAC_00234 [Tieghemostelium lacteum]
MIPSRTQSKPITSINHSNSNYAQIAATVVKSSPPTNTSLPIPLQPTTPSKPKDFESEFPSLQQTYKKHYRKTSVIHKGLEQNSNNAPTINQKISEKDIELLKSFRNENLDSSKSGIDVDCWKKRDLLYYCFIQKPQETQKILNFINMVASYYQLPSRSSILDIGCGLGRMFEMWDRSKWQHIDAFEPDKDYYQFALDHATNISEKVNVYNMGFLELSHVKCKYDMVVSIHGPFQYLTQLHDRVQAVKNCYDALKPGGVLLLDVSNFLDALKNLRPQFEQRMLVNGVPVKRISNITVDTFKAIWSIEDIFYSHSNLDININNNNNSNNSNGSSINSSINNYDYEDENISISSSGYSGSNVSELDTFEYADGGLVVEKLEFSILGVAELQLLLLSAGFMKLKVVSRWDTNNINESINGPRIIITGQKPFVSQVVNGYN